MEFRDTPNEERLKERTAVAEPETAREVTAPTTASETAVRNHGIFRAELIIYYILGVMEVLLGLRLVLALLNTTDTINNASGFAQFIYNTADPLTLPFYGLFNTASGGEPGVGVIITAMVIYALVGWGIARLLRIGRA